MIKLIINSEVKSYVKLMQTLNTESTYLDYEAFLTFAQLKDKKLKRKVLLAVDFDTTKITMSIISHMLSEIYPVWR